MCAHLLTACACQVASEHAFVWMDKTEWPSFLMTVSVVTTTISVTVNVVTTTITLTVNVVTTTITVTVGVVTTTITMNVMSSTSSQPTVRLTCCSTGCPTSPWGAYPPCAARCAPPP